MQPTKSKSTRYQPKGLYITAAILLTISVAFNVSDQFADEWFDSFTNGLKGASPIQWRDKDEALSEAKRTKKPLLYAFLARHDNASLQMYGDGFHDQKVAQLINQNFIPVRVDFNSRDYDHKSKLYTKLHNQYGYTSTCQLLTVPAHMTDMSSSDLESSANLSEACIDNTAGLERGDRYNHGYNSRYRSGCVRSDGLGFTYNSPKFIGYTNKRELLDYLYGAQHWHRLPPTKGKVAWLPLAVASTSLTSKPRLIAFVDNAGSASDNMRLDTFWNSRDYKLINKEFEPVLVEFRHGDAAFNEPLEKLKEKYGIATLPALVIDSSNLAAPIVQFGNSNSVSTHEFLKSAVNKAAAKL
ncbi:thioredoxin family protein [bacterium]|nr:thioredoxin family protein [bacterium]MBP9806891.1 thioredoxin family protein [bacterium]